MTELPAMREGAVAVIDALAFKGIWKRNDYNKVLATLRSARDAATFDFDLQNLMMTGGWYDVLQFRFFSDTIVIVGLVPNHALASPARPATLSDVISGVIDAVNFIITQAVHRDPALLYRGCIAAGRLVADGEFFVGEAIDEAAEWEQRADAAVVWLLPSARDALQKEPRDIHQRVQCVEWDVPLKQAGYLRTLVVNPLAQGGPGLWKDMPGRIPLDDLRKRVLDAFGEERSVSVEIKKQNTERLLNEAHRVVVDYYDMRGPPPDPPSAKDFFAMTFPDTGGEKETK
jgi:hypothetical protein